MQKRDESIANSDGSVHPMTPQIVHRWQRHCASFITLELRGEATLYRQGECCTQVYYVASGYMKLAATDRDGNGFIRSILHIGDFFGVLSGQHQQCMADTAISKGAVRLHRCDADEFFGVLAIESDMSRYLLASLNMRLTFAQRQAEAALYSPALKRVALMLHELTGRRGGRCRHGHEIDIRLTQQELAELVGASRPMVSTILNDLRQRRILSYTRSFICIENMASFQRLLE